MDNNSISLSILLAFIIDLFLGDPPYFPHPVKGIGFLITCVEDFLETHMHNRKIGGVALVIMILSLTYCITTVTLNIAGMIHPLIRFAASTVIIYFSLSIKDLYKESMAIYKKLLQNNIPESRKKLSRIVGRDTESLSKAEIVRGTVESTAEGIVDGILSPIFFASIGGAPLCAVYKAINTLDSMVGYKNEQYLEFGWASAKLDDIANYIPARISGILIPLAAFLCKKNWAYSLLTVIHDRKKHPSPNSGFPEAGIAGALQVQLGGENIYHGVQSKKPLIGARYRNPGVADILETNKIMMVTSCIMVFLLLL